MLQLLVRFTHNSVGQGYWASLLFKRIVMPFVGTTACFSLSVQKCILSSMKANVVHFSRENSTPVFRFWVKYNYKKLVGSPRQRCATSSRKVATARVLAKTLPTNGTILAEPLHWNALMPNLSGPTSHRCGAVRGTGKDRGERGASFPTHQPSVY